MELSSKIISDDEMSSDSSPKSSKEFERESLSRTDTIVLRGQVDEARRVSPTHLPNRARREGVFTQSFQLQASLCAMPSFKTWHFETLNGIKIHRNGKPLVNKKSDLGYIKALQQPNKASTCAAAEKFLDHAIQVGTCHVQNPLCFYR